MKQREQELLLDLMEQGYMEDIVKYQKEIRKTKGIVRTIVYEGYQFYLQMVVNDFYLPLVRCLIKLERIS